MKKHYKAVLSLLENCRSMVEIKQLHCLMIKSSVIEDIIPLSKLIDFCTDPENGSMNYANSLFVSIDHPNEYKWNSMIRGYSNTQCEDKALVLYREMLQKGYSPNHFTFPFVLKACSRLKDCNFGRLVHSYVAKTGFQANMYVSTCLLHMYMNCGEVNCGLKIFEEIPKSNIVAWGSLISGFVGNNQFRDAIHAFRDMIGNGVEPNEMITVDVFVACGRIKDIETGKWVHGLTRELGFDPFCPSQSDFNVILATSVIDMYGRCGDLRTARYLFYKMPERNLISWNSIITSYSQSGNGEETLKMFTEMQDGGFVPDKVTIFSLIRVSVIQGNARLGQSIHGYVLRTGITKDTAIICALVDMYAKTGNAESAKRVFENLKKKDTIAWTVMIMGLASHGHGEEALRMFERMQKEGNAAPDGITYLGALYACSHVGLVGEGRKYFAEMRDLYRIEPTIEHYGCMIDTLSRAGEVEEAERLAETMPVQANANVWGALLNGCEIHGNIDLADRVRSRLSETEEIGSGIYVILSNIYAKAGRWYDVKQVRESMESKRIAKATAHSSFETLF